MKTFYIVIGISLLLFIIGLIIKAIINNLHFEADEISLDNKWVNDAFYDGAHSLVKERFEMLGKPIKTKKGAYRVNYMNEVNKVAAANISTCCEGDRLSRDLCIFINDAYPDIRRKELNTVILDYLDKRERAIKDNMDVFLNQFQDLTPEEFFEIRQHQKGDVVGVYIIHNETNGQYYVGQAKKLFFRINQHFTGHGNGDVYADYKYGDDFSIKIIRLSDSGYDDIDKLEKDMIEKYNAYDIGYNKTSGNY